MLVGPMMLYLFAPFAAFCGAAPWCLFDLFSFVETIAWDRDLRPQDIALIQNWCLLAMNQGENLETAS